MIETIILCTVFGVFILLAYTIGLKNGQKLKENKPIELPKISEKIKEVAKSIKKEDTGLTKQDLIEWENINNYTGTSEGQKPIN